LDYAFKARNIKNKPVSNTVSSKRTVLREHDKEIEDLRFQLQAQRDKSGTFLPTEK
jgi:kinesin family protein 11